jgi:hypothetical protein
MPRSRFLHPGAAKLNEVSVCDPKRTFTVRLCRGAPDVRGLSYGRFSTSKRLESSVILTNIVRSTKGRQDVANYAECIGSANECELLARLSRDEAVRTHLRILRAQFLDMAKRLRTVEGGSRFVLAQSCSQTKTAFAEKNTGRCFLVNTSQISGDLDGDCNKQ